MLKFSSVASSFQKRFGCRLCIYSQLLTCKTNDFFCVLDFQTYWYHIVVFLNLCHFGVETYLSNVQNVNECMFLMAFGTQSTLLVLRFPCLGKYKLLIVENIQSFSQKNATHQAQYVSPSLLYSNHHYRKRCILQQPHSLMNFISSSSNSNQSSQIAGISSL